MNSPDGKLTIFQHLARKSTPSSLPELMADLGSIYPERTVRRWLNQLVEEGLVLKSGHTKSSKYVVVTKQEKESDKVVGCFSSDSLNSIAKITRPLYQRSFVAYNDEWFDAYEPNESFYLSKNLRDQLFQAGWRGKGQDAAGTYAHRIFNRLLIDLSYNSSRLEGNTYSLLDTERLLLHGTGAEGKLDEEKIMILNHKEAIRYLVDNAFRMKIDEHVIYTLHWLLSEGLVEDKYAGKIRDHVVRIVGSVYFPFEDPKRLEMQLKRVADKASLIEDPFEQSLFLLIHISYLQAFTDVNKRTARLAANIPLICKNLVPLSFNDVERSDYASAMIAVYELQDVSPIVDLFVFSYMRTCEAYDSTVKAMGFDETRVLYRSQRRTLIRYIVSNRIAGEKLPKKIEEAAREEIPEKDREKFVEDVLEDLEHIDKNRISGLGITPGELEDWLKLRSS